MNEETLKKATKEELIDMLENQLDYTEQLQNNWNELKKWIEEDKEVAETNFEMGRCFNYRDILSKMQELEGNNE